MTRDTSVPLGSAEFADTLLTFRVWPGGATFRKLIRRDGVPEETLDRCLFAAPPPR